jgi:hypothetical protein
MPDAKMYRVIYGVCKQCAVDNELLHDIVRMRFSKDSLKNLTKRECAQLIDGLRGKEQRFGRSGHAHTGRGAAMQQDGRKDAANGGTEYLVNERELRMLREVATLRGWDMDTLDRFIRRQLRGRAIRTMADLNKVLWPLKAMNRRDGLSEARG